MALMIDARLYRERLAAIARWSREAERYDQEQARLTSGSESLRQAFELSNLVAKLAPPPTSRQLERLARDRASFAERLAIFEVRRRRGGP
jgi:hypothetical protein